MEAMGDRLKWCRKRYGLTQRGLAGKAKVGLATVRRIEQNAFMPRFDTATRLAETLYINPGWLAFGEGNMVSLGHMTVAEQRRLHNGAESAGLSGYVIVGPGTWCRDGDVWVVERGA